MNGRIELLSSIEPPISPCYHLFSSYRLPLLSPFRKFAAGIPFSSFSTTLVFTGSVVLPFSALLASSDTSSLLVLLLKRFWFVTGKSMEAELPTKDSLVAITGCSRVLLSDRKTLSWFLLADSRRDCRYVETSLQVANSCP